MEYAAIFLPLFGSVFGYLSKYFGNLFPILITTLFVFASSILSTLIFYNGIVNDSYGNYLIYKWVTSGNFVANWSINIDPVSYTHLTLPTKA